MARFYASATAVGSMILAFGGKPSSSIYCGSGGRGGGGALAFTTLPRGACQRSLMGGGDALGDMFSRTGLRTFYSGGSICARRRCSSESLAPKLVTSPCEHQLLLRRQRTTRTAPSSVAIMSGSDGNLEDLAPPGTIVAFETEARGRSSVLGLVVDRTGGKKKPALRVKPASAGAPTVTVALRQVKYVVPGGSGYFETDLANFEEEETAEADVDDSLLEEAWQVLLEEDESGDADGGGGFGGGGERAGVNDPRSMAQLLFGVVEPSPKECYRAFRLLEGEGALRFKRRRDGRYECRSRCVRASAVELMQMQIER